MHRIIALAFYLNVLLLVAAAPVAAQEAEAGEANYDRVICWSCHGYEGQGGRHGPAIVRTQLPYEAFSSFVRNTSGSMPPYTVNVLSEQELQDIYAFLQAIPLPPDRSTILLLQ